MTQNPFEMTQQIRELAEKNVEQARAAYRQYIMARNSGVNFSEAAGPGRCQGLTARIFDHITFPLSLTALGH